MAVGSVQQERLIPASAQVLWPLITNTEHVKVWYAFGGAEIDPRPGGHMLLSWTEHGDFPAVVETVEPNRRFCFRWLPAPGPLVEISLEPADGGTRVRIIESGGLDDPEASILAWRNGLNLLAQLATKE